MSRNKDSSEGLFVGWPTYSESADIGKSSDTGLFLGKVSMLGAWNRAEHYRDLAEECLRLAATSLSSQMRRRYSQMADQYAILAEAEEPGTLAYDD
jgi:hypothetical protein